ncbi:Non-histone chromosomal protein 6 [Malassezia sp. CBS 17886]|nr:Non-histone chromosomal protein 6 [Malassezia sp. CBS 17886]
MPKEAKPKVAPSARKTKAKKDPAAPKRPLSAYMFFSQDWRERVKTENPDAGFGDVGRLLGTKWKEMSDEDKKPYNDMADRDKTRAESEKAAYAALGVCVFAAQL